MGCKGILCTRAKRPTCPKSVSFCREEECAVFTADDYDRTPVAPSRDLSTRDYQELEEVLCDSLRRGRGQLSVGVLPLLQNPEPPSSPPPPTKFPTTPGRFTSFSFLPVNVSPPPDPSQQVSRPAPSPPRTTPQQTPPAQRTFPGFAFMSVVPVSDTPTPKPPPVPESRPMNFIRTVTRPTSPPPASATVQRPSSPVVPVSCSFKRAPPQQQQQQQVPSHMVTRPSQSPASAAQPMRSPPSPSGFRSPSSGQALPLCVPTGGAPTSPPHSLLRTLAS